MTVYFELIYKTNKSLFYNKYKINIKMIENNSDHFE